MTTQIEIEGVDSPLVSNENLMDSVIQAHINEEAEQPEEIPPVENIDFEGLKDYTETSEEPNKFSDVKNSPEQSSKDALNNLIDTDILVTLCDIVLSRLFFFLFNRRLGKDVAIQDFELTPEEAKSVSKLLKEYMKTQEIKVSPLMALIIGIVSIYGGKALIAFSSAPKDKTEQRTIKQQTKSTGKRGRPPGVKNKPKEGAEI